MNEMTIANRLNELIAEKRIQKKQLAERIGVAASTLNTWLSRGEDFPAQYVIPICDVLGISAEKLLVAQREHFVCRFVEVDAFCVFIARFRGKFIIWLIPAESLDFCRFKVFVELFEEFCELLARFRAARQF